MSTGTDIIIKAFKKNGAYSEVSTAPPIAISDGKDTLNSMLQLWQDEDIELGIAPLKAPGDELGEPAGTTMAIIYNLAVFMAPDYNVTVSPELIALAERTKSTVRSLYEVLDVPKKVPSSTLIKGSGHQDRFSENVFVTKGKSLDA